MYKKKMEEDLDCGIQVTMKLFGGKWKFCIVDAISRGINRPSEIHRYLPEATPRVIDMQLRELEMHKVVEKKVYPGFPLKVEYSLTALGESILPIMQQIDRWGKTNSEIVKLAVAEEQEAELATA